MPSQNKSSVNKNRKGWRHHRNNSSGNSNPSNNNNTNNNSNNNHSQNNTNSDDSTSDEASDILHSFSNRFKSTQKCKITALHCVGNIIR